MSPVSRVVDAQRYPQGCPAEFIVAGSLLIVWECRTRLGDCWAGPTHPTVEHTFDKFKVLTHTPEVLSTPNASPGFDDGYPIRPAADHTHCLHGHLLALAGINHSHSHAFARTESTCNLCWTLRLEPHTWVDIDVTRLTSPSDPRASDGLVLVARPPVARTDVGRIEMRLQRIPIGVVAVQLCGADQRGVLHHVEVKDEYRRRGIGSVLVAAAMKLGSGYSWSTTKINGSPEVRAFCASIDSVTSIHLDEPLYCSHMRAIDEI